MGFCILRQTSTRTDRTRDRHRGQRIDQPQIFVCKLLSWEAQLLPPLLLASEPDIDDVDCGQLVGAGLGGNDHGGYETGSCDVGFGGDVVADGLSRRMPTW